MRLKAGVKFKNIKPELLFALMISDSIYKNLFGQEMVITSLLDGVHSDLSLHYAGYAADIRTRNIHDFAMKQKLANELKTALPECDVVLESDHIHLEVEIRRK